MRLSALALVLLAGCAGSRGIGHLDPEYVRHVQQRQGAWRAKLISDGQGSLTKLTVYHREGGAVPQAIQDLAMQRFPGAKIESYETELYDGEGWVHEVEVTTAEGRNCELSASASGAQLRYVECRLAREELKPEILQKAQALVPGAEVQEVETHEGGSRSEVRVELLKDGVTHYLVFATDGNLLEHQLRLPAILAVPAP